jgi:hypothetical protein
MTRGKEVCLNTDSNQAVTTLTTVIRGPCITTRFFLFKRLYSHAGAKAQCDTSTSICSCSVYLINKVIIRNPPVPFFFSYRPVVILYTTNPSHSSGLSHLHPQTKPLDQILILLDSPQPFLLVVRDDIMSDVHYSISFVPRHLLPAPERLTYGAIFQSFLLDRRLRPSLRLRFHLRFRPILGQFLSHDEMSKDIEEMIIGIPFRSFLIASQFILEIMAYEISSFPGSIRTERAPVALIVQDLHQGSLCSRQLYPVFIPTQSQSVDLPAYLGPR